MIAVAGKTIKDIDKEAMEVYRIPGLVLMENAALRVVELLEKQVYKAGDRVVVIAGKGNNGGDALAVFRHLINLNYDSYLVYACPLAAYGGDARIQQDIIEKMLVPSDRLFNLESKGAEARAYQLIGQADILVDGLFGTGFQGQFPENLLSLVDAYQASSATKIAIDIPSGLDSNTGLGKTVMEASVTVTLGLVKIGLFLDQEKRAGEVYLGDISLPKPLIASIEPTYQIATKKDMSELLGQRKMAVHKGTCGKVTLVGGSRGLTGAMYLAAEGGVRAGAGLVTCLVPMSINDILEVKLTEAMTLPLETKAGSLQAEHAELIIKETNQGHAWVLGPGMGRADGAKQLVELLLAKIKVPLVIDADGLYHLASLFDKDIYDQPKRIMTPHEGEAARLLDWSVDEVRQDRIRALKALHATYGGIILLKGSRTLIYDGHQVMINTTGNPGMATGGSGDVLSGIIGTYLAQGMEAFSAACLGAYVHGLAGDLAAGLWGEEAMKAGDIPSFLGQAIQAIREVPYRQAHLQKIV